MKEIFETFLILAGVQGILLSAFLFTKKQNHTANIVLGIAMLALSISLFQNVYYSRGIYKQWIHLMGISYPFPYLYGPLFYIYTKLVSKKEEYFLPSNLMHFIPVFIVYCIGIPEYFASSADKIKFVENMIIEVRPPVYVLIESIIPIQGIVYTILTIRIVMEYNKKIKDSFSNIDVINLNWLKYLTYGMIIIWSIVAIMDIGSLIDPSLWGIENMLPLSIAILIYWIGY